MLKITNRIWVLILLCIPFITSCNRIDSDTHKMLKELNKVVAQKTHYADSVQSHVDSLMACMGEVTSKADAEREYQLAKQLYEASRLFSFEYAQKAASRMVLLAQYLEDADAIAESKTLQAYNYARTGFFHEAQDSLNNIILDSVSDAIRGKFYIIRGKVYHDLATYTHDDKYTPYYNQIGNEYLRKSLDYIKDSVIINYIQGEILTKDDMPGKAKGYYLRALQLCNEENAEMKGRLLSNLGNTCRNIDEIKEATQYYIDACKICISNAHRDVNLIRATAEMLYNDYDDVDASSLLINLAIENVQSFGTRSRINSMGALMPIYMGQKLQKETTAKYISMTLLCVIALLMVVLLILLRRFHARNRQLNNINDQLEDANKIKETYLGMIINSQSEFSFDLNHLAMVAEQKLKMQQYDALLKLISQLERKYNGTKILSTFDNVFLSIYPSFIKEVNDLLLPEHRMTPKKEGELPPMMRIFAMIRLGITNNNSIATALNYSYNTVHNYRVRVRNMSYNPEDFEEKVAKIGSSIK